mmetsp:Transcript_38372/g.94020  ORF Transcript_38372/g.94020 Transcript_38372/m.94020 type:complete len:324 (+) Transcript_38372:732-1703(+)
MVHADPVGLMLLHSISHAIPHVPGVPPPLLVHPVRHLTLVEVRAATLPGPQSKVLKGVLHRQAIHRHVIPSDVHPGLARVLGRSRGSSRGVIRPPKPQVVSHHIARRNVHHARRLHVRVPVGTSNSTKHIRNHSRVLRRPLVLTAAPLNQRRTGHRTGFKNHPRHTNTVNVSDLDHRIPLPGHKNRKSQSKHHSPRLHHLQRLLQLIRPRRDHNMHALGQLLVDVSCCVSFLRHKHLLKTHFLGRRPVHTARLALHLRNVQVVQPLAVDCHVRFLCDNRGLLHSHSRKPSGIVPAVVLGSTLHTHKDHVPHPLHPLPDLRIPG